MAQEKLSMRKTKEILRLYWCNGLSKPVFERWSGLFGQDEWLKGRLSFFLGAKEYIIFSLRKQVRGCGDPPLQIMAVRGIKKHFCNVSATKG